MSWSGKPPTAESVRTWIGHLEREAERFATVVTRSPLPAHVPAYPDFTVHSLSAHIGRALRLFHGILTTGGGTYAASRGAHRRGYRRLGAGGRRPLVTLLSEVPPDQLVPFPHQAGDRPAGLIAPLFAVEVGVHRWDVETVLGEHVPIPSDLAVREVENVFTNFVPRLAARGVADIGGIVGLRTTDTAARLECPGAATPPGDRARARRPLRHRRNCGRPGAGHCAAGVEAGRCRPGPNWRSPGQPTSSSASWRPITSPTRAPRQRTDQHGRADAAQGDAPGPPPARPRQPGRGATSRVFPADGRAAPSVRDCSRSAAKQPRARNVRSTSRDMQRVLTTTLWAKARHRDRADPARQWLHDRRLRKMAPDAAVRDHPRRRGNNPHSLFETAPARSGTPSNIASTTRSVGTGRSLVPPSSAAA